MESSAEPCTDVEMEACGAEKMEAASSADAKEGEGGAAASRTDGSGEAVRPSPSPACNGVPEDDSVPSEKSSNSLPDVETPKEDAASAKEPEGVEEGGAGGAKEPEDEGEEDESGEDGEEEAPKPGLPKFLRRHIKLGRYQPVTAQQANDFRMRDSEAVMEAPSLTVPLLIKEPNRILVEGGAAPEKKEKKPLLPVQMSENFPAGYFESAVGQFLIGLGLSQALEVVNRDRVRLKDRERRKAGGVRSAEMTEEHRKVSAAYKQVKNANAPFSFRLKSCKVCDFKTESSLVLDGHLLTPHFTSRREVRCGMCAFVTRDAKAFVSHVTSAHGRQPTIEPPPQFHECPFCTFETKVKSKAANHVSRCEKYFNSRMNQLPSPSFDAPGHTCKPVTVEDIREYEKFCQTLASPVRGKDTPQSRPAATYRNGPNTMFGLRGMVQAHPRYPKLAPLPSQNHNASSVPQRPPFQTALASSKLLQAVKTGSKLLPARNGSPQLTITVSPRPPVSSAPPRPLATPSMPTLQAARPRGTPTILESGGSGAAAPPTGGASGGAFVICEICDGYIKDLEQLRTHMQWIHQVKIHPKMLASRPPLNCQKCQWRFFTDQGLERHLLGSHGLVTSNMQELANAGRDTGRCTVCGRIYASKLVAHMSQVHRVVLKPAHLSYKCTVCTMTFNLYRLFESHVYTVHGGASKRPAPSDGQAAKRPATNDNQATKRPAPNDNQATKRPTVAALLPVAKPDVPSRTVTRKPEAASAPAASPSPQPVASPAPEETASGKKTPELEVRRLGDWCAACKDYVPDLAEHVQEKHMRRCRVRVCHIEKCDRCLRSFDGMIVVDASGSSSDEEDEEDEEEGADSSEEEEGEAPDKPKGETAEMDLGKPDN